MLRITIKEYKVMSVASTLEIIQDIKAGKMVILTDAEDRENEGDLLVAAQFITPEMINFMVTHARGLVCVTLTADMVNKFNLPFMAPNNGTKFGTNFTVSVEAAEGVTTGISAYDRAHTIQTLVSPTSKAEDIVQPGHIFPVRAEKGGVLVRAGHTEAGCDLTTLAGLTPSAVICEVLKEDGTMAHMLDLIEFGQKHGIKIGTIADLIAYRSQNESLIEKLDESLIQTTWGEFTQVVFADKLTDETHIALVKGKPDPNQEVLVRVHEPFSAMDFLSQHQAHSWSLPEALSHINTQGCGIVILLHREEDGLSLREKALAHHNPGAIKWDSKTYGIGAQMLSSLNAGRVRIMGKPSALTGLTGFGLEVVGFEQAPH
ncbi:bifunctional 3,4-dihydroxy-2-butanone-4-phosphate synthase/GTP cyclohydrolase II [Neisseria sp. Ec49-e6-T10]|uniref:bifunctional 3,4-dihydroxy-2-butanone-4-phosphate synthase/GTP cyclohydrolase II n=1 Tax=Neisseria sp. Ec49-e6-T10 TaxID=3140744 RepID=UPI003EBB94A6